MQFTDKNCLYKRIYFIHFPHTEKGGLPIIDERNKIMLSSFSDEVIDVIFLPYAKEKNKFLHFLKILKIICGFCPNEYIDFKQFDLKTGEKKLLFFSHSTYGLYVKQIKKKYSNVEIISFFHNVESEFHKRNLKVKKTLSEFKLYLLTRMMESLLLKYSDKIVVLNDRDCSLLVQKYKYSSAFLLPTTIPDRYNKLHKKKINIDKRLSLLFVGTLFLANQQGVLWLVKNIAKYVDVDIQIVGVGMDKLALELADFSNVYITGEVDDSTLDKFYYEADIFISTLFIGGGMKTKIAEAMMFALPIIGTEESFQGYHIDHSKVGLLSNNAYEIITFINYLDANRHLLEEYAQNSRNIFLKQYSYSSSLNKMKNILLKN